MHCGQSLLVLHGLESYLGLAPKLKLNHFFCEMSMESFVLLDITAQYLHDLTLLYILSSFYLNIYMSVSKPNFFVNIPIQCPLKT